MPGKRNRGNRLLEIRHKLISSYKEELIILSEILENFPSAQKQFENDFGEDIFNWPPICEIRSEILKLKKRRKYFYDQGWKENRDDITEKKLRFIENKIYEIIFEDIKIILERAIIDGCDSSGHSLYGERSIDEEAIRLDLAEKCRAIALSV